MEVEPFDEWFPRERYIQFRLICMYFDHETALDEYIGYLEMDLNLNVE